MDTNSIMMMLQDKLPKDAMSLASLRDKLDKLNDTQRDKFHQTMSFIKLKSPIVGLILGLLFGGLGVDRFYKGNIGLGVLKIILLIVSYSLFFGGFLGVVVVGGLMLFLFAVWVVADFFFVYKGIKKDNLAKVMTALSNV